MRRAGGWIFLSGVCMALNLVVGKAFSLLGEEVLVDDGESEIFEGCRDDR